MATVQQYVNTTSAPMNWIEIDGIGQIDTVQGYNAFQTTGENAVSLLQDKTFYQDNLAITQVIGVDRHTSSDNYLATNDHSNFWSQAYDYVRFANDNNAVNYEIDIVVQAEVTVIYTLADGTEHTKTVDVGIFQLVNETEYRTFILPINPTDLDSLGVIQSIHINTVDPVDDGLLYGNYTIVGTAVCFAAGTLIETAVGEIPVEELSVGDQVVTRDNGLQSIRWIEKQTLTELDLTRHPKIKPIRIRAGALGKNIPKTDLVVSPQHRILVRSKIVRNVIGDNEALIAAKQLIGIDGIEIINDGGVVYYHMLFNNHEVIYSNGAETESLYAGKEAIKALSSESLNEILKIFPNIKDGSGNMAAVRKIIFGRRARNLVERHKKNDKYLVDNLDISS